METIAGRQHLIEQRFALRTLSERGKRRSRSMFRASQLQFIEDRAQPQCLFRRRERCRRFKECAAEFGICDVELCAFFGTRRFGNRIDRQANPSPSFYRSERIPKARERSGEEAAQMQIAAFSKRPD